MAVAVEVPAATPAADEAPVASVAAQTSDDENPGLTCAELRGGGSGLRFLLDFAQALGHCPR